MKQPKNLLLLLPALFVGATAVTGFSQSQPILEAIQFPQAVEAAQIPGTEKENTAENIGSAAAEIEETGSDVSETTEVAAGTGNYEDGTYEGTGTGYSGDVKVKVTVKDHQIVSVEILSTKDDAAFFNRAKKLTDTIVTAQTWEVDSVSGATYSSRGIREAVKNALTGSTEKSKPKTNSTKKKAVKKTSYKGSGSWKDGTFTGSAEGYGGTIKVEVTIKNGKIDKINVTSHDGETSSYYNKAKKIIKSIIKKQSPNVDTVSGATYSSTGIKNAVIKALKKAEGKKGSSTKDDADSVDPTPQKPGVSIGGDSKDETPAEGTTIKDGTYHVSAECVPDEDEDFDAYTISCDVTFKDQKLVSMTNFKATDESNKVYYNRAINGRGSQKGVVDQLLSAQSAANINAVTGATCSSITVRKLYLAALTEATGKDQTDDGKDGQKPDTPNQPDQPNTPDTPDQPDTPDTPDQPDKPDTPDQPDKPDTPDQPDKPDTPDQPDTPDKPDEDEVVDGIKSGTYSVSTTVEPDKYKSFTAYTLSCKVTFKKGKVTAMTDFTLSDTRKANVRCTDLAKDTMIPKILDKQSADVDTVTDATCSSKAIKELYKEALKKAKE